MASRKRTFAQKFHLYIAVEVEKIAIRLEDGQVDAERALQSGPGCPSPYGLGAWQLFNVVEDPDDSRDLAKEMPDLLEELRAGVGTLCRRSWGRSSRRLSSRPLGLNSGAGGGGRTRTTIRSRDFKSVNFLYRPQPSTCLTTLDNHQNSDRQSLKAFSSYGGRCWQCGLLRKNVP